MLHMIGNAHLDPVWLWRWPEGCAEAIATCWSAVDRLDEDPRSSSPAARPSCTLDRGSSTRRCSRASAALVAAGRWVIVGGWWVQPDCNLPSGESVVRQALYGKRYFADRFGVDVTVGYNVDSLRPRRARCRCCCATPASTATCSCARRRTRRPCPAELFGWVAPDGVPRANVPDPGRLHHRAARHADRAEDRAASGAERGGRPSVHVLLRRRQPRRRADARGAGRDPRPARRGCAGGVQRSRALLRRGARGRGAARWRTSCSSTRSAATAPCHR